MPSYFAPLLIAGRLFWWVFARHRVLALDTTGGFLESPRPGRFLSLQARDRRLLKAHTGYPFVCGLASQHGTRRGCRGRLGAHPGRGRGLGGRNSRRGARARRRSEPPFAKESVRPPPPERCLCKPGLDMVRNTRVDSLVSSENIRSRVFEVWFGGGVTFHSEHIHLPGTLRAVVDEAGATGPSGSLAVAAPWFPKTRRTIVQPFQQLPVQCFAQHMQTLRSHIAWTTARPAAYAATHAAWRGATLVMGWRREVALSERRLSWSARTVACRQTPQSPRRRARTRACGPSVRTLTTWAAIFAPQAPADLERDIIIIIIVIIISNIVCFISMAIFTMNLFCYIIDIISSCYCCVTYIMIMIMNYDYDYYDYD